MGTEHKGDTIGQLMLGGITAGEELAVFGSTRRTVSLVQEAVLAKLTAAMAACLERPSSAARGSRRAAKHGDEGL